MAPKEKNSSFPKKGSRLGWALDLKNLIASLCVSVSTELHGHSAQPSHHVTGLWIQPSFRLASTTPASVNKVIACLEVKQKGNGPGNYPIWFWMSISSGRDLRSPIVTTAGKQFPANKDIKRPTQVGESLQS